MNDKREQIEGLKPVTGEEWDLRYSIDFMIGWLEDAPAEVVRNWKRVQAAAEELRSVRYLAESRGEALESNRAENESIRAEVARNATPRRTGEGFGRRMMAERGERRVVCAACLYPNGTIIVGPRHFDNTMRAQRDIELYEQHGKAIQGFIDQWGVFMDRKEAWKVAESQGQILFRCGGDSTDGGTLYSENLY